MVHPELLVKRPESDKKYDLREIALWILDNPKQAEYRLSDWWAGPLRQNQRPPFEHLDGTPVYFLGHDVELAAYRLITAACRDEVYAPADMDLALRGGAPA